MRTVHSKGQLRALNGMRGVAVLLVFFSHTSGRGMGITDWLNFHGLGHIGVYLFFVLSGYLLTRNFIAGQSYIQYFSRRFFRIAPLYYIVLSCVAIYQGLGYFSPRYLHVKGEWISFLQHYLFVRGDGIFWTIPSEFIFYYLLPGVVYFIGKFGSKWIAGFSLGYFLWYLMVQFNIYDVIPPKFILISHESQYLDVFFCGVIGAYLEYHFNDKLAASLFWGLLLLSLCCVSKSFLFFNRPFFELRWMSLVYGLVFMIAIVSTSQGNKWIARPLNSKLLCTIGISGFGWYLLHMPIIQFINIIFADTTSYLKFFLSFILLLLLNIYINRFVEVPGIRLGHQFERILTNRRFY